MAASASSAKTTDKSSDKSGKSDKPKPQDGLSKQLGALLKNALIALLVFVLMVFILGEAYAFYIMKFNSMLLLWLPVLALVAILVYKVFD